MGVMRMKKTDGGYRNNDLVLEIGKKTVKQSPSKNRLDRVVLACSLDREIMGKNILKKINK